MLLFTDNLVLENSQLQLRPSRLEDASELYTLADSGIWAHSSTSITSEEDMQTYLRKALLDRENNLRQQFTIKDQVHQRLLGCSSFENVSSEHKRLEIGWTWLGLEFQGKGYNPIAKYLMLQYAFDVLQFDRVEFRARETNIQSQKALAKIGATKEGTLRSYFYHEGQRHGFVYFSILKPEWPALKETVFANYGE